MVFQGSLFVFLTVTFLDVTGWGLNDSAETSSKADSEPPPTEKDNVTEFNSKSISDVIPSFGDQKEHTMPGDQTPNAVDHPGTTAEKLADLAARTERSQSARA